MSENVSVLLALLVLASIGYISIKRALITLKEQRS